MSEEQGSHIEVDRLLASFDNNDDTMSELLDRMGLLAYIEAIEDEGERAKVRAEVVDKLKSALEEINQQPINQGQAKTQFQIGKKHFNLHKLVFTTLELGAAALVVVVLPPVAPLTALAAGVAIAPAAVSIIGKLNEIVHTLTPEELAVYNAVAGVIVEKKKKALAEHRGANPDEIKAYFISRKETPLKLDAILKSLEAKKVIEPFAGGDGQATYYKPVP